MNIAFISLATAMLLSAAAAMALPNPVHCVLCLVVTFAAMAGLFLQLDAQFVAFAQVLVYIGAVGILLVFALMLTGNAPTTGKPKAGAWAGLLITLLAGGTLVAVVISDTSFRKPLPPVPQAGVKQLGERMLTGGPEPGRAHYIVPLEAAGLLLTAALIGAAVVALPERRKP